jgi:hypothetical protein
MGAIASTRKVRLNSRALSVVSKRSRMMARAITTPEQAASPCAKRPRASASIEGAKASASDTSV